MSKFVALVCGLLLSITCSQSFELPALADFVEEYTGQLLEAEESFKGTWQKFIKAALKWAWKECGDHCPLPGPKEYPYFNVIPARVGSVVPGGPAVSWAGKCFKKYSAQAAMDGSDIKVTVTRSDPSSATCSDYYFFATVENYHLDYYYFHGTSHFTWKVPSTLSTTERWDVMNQGIRVFLSPHDLSTLVKNLVQTVLLFEPDTTHGVAAADAARNVDFLNKYTNKNYAKRNGTAIVNINKTRVRSGDFVGVIRMDGLDPMLALGMGGTTGHTTTALWLEKEGENVPCLNHHSGTCELYITESTGKSSYWTVNGVQKTPYDQWMEWAHEASYQVVWAPLNDKYAAQYNVTAAVEFFKTVEGLDYGYENMLWSWVDTTNSNYPCMPPDFKSGCLTWELLEIAFPLLGKLAPNIAIIWKQAFNHRMGTHGLPLADIYYLAHQRNITTASIPAIVELDSYRYNMTRYGAPVTDGRAMVCCVFVCNMWKAAGLMQEIGNEFECAEMTNVDDYALDIFQPASQKPPECRDAGPQCQIMGEYTLELSHYNSKQMWKHMGNKCPSQNPDYIGIVDNC